MQSQKKKKRQAEQHQFLIWAPVQVPAAPFPAPLLSTSKATQDGLSAWVPASIWESHLWLFWPFEEFNQQMKSLFLSHFNSSLSNKLIYTKKILITKIIDVILLWNLFSEQLLSEKQRLKEHTRYQKKKQDIKICYQKFLPNRQLVSKSSTFILCTSQLLTLISNSDLLTPSYIIIA